MESGVMNKIGQDIHGPCMITLFNQTPIVEFYMPTSVFKTTTKKTRATLKLDYVLKRKVITVHNMPIYLNLQFDAIPLLCFLPRWTKYLIINGPKRTYNLANYFDPPLLGRHALRPCWNCIT